MLSKGNLPFVSYCKFLALTGPMSFMSWILFKYLINTGMEAQLLVLVTDNSDKHACLKEHHVRSNITWYFIMIFRIVPKHKYCTKEIASLKKGR